MSAPQTYVLGFAFAPDLGRVVLIRKEHPDWMKGKLNGVGGKVELYERWQPAMRREFLEEVGLDIPEDRWTVAGNFWGDWGSVQVFKTVLAQEEFDAAYSTTDEQVEKWLVHALRHPDCNAMKNVPLLVELCLRDDILGFSLKDVGTA